MRRRGQIVVEDGVVAGNVYPKYSTRNPVARRLMDGFLTAFDELVSQAGCSTVHEVGCGEGELSIRLANGGLTVLGTDFSSTLVDIARETAIQRNVPAQSLRFDTASIYDLVPATHAAELVVCCEVLEHLERPGDAISLLGGLASPYLLVSVPREPLWRALNILRGKYLPSFGNTPGHLNWWSKKAFVSFVQSGSMEVVAVRSPLPWTMILLRAKAPASTAR